MDPLTADAAANDRKCFSHETFKPNHLRPGGHARDAVARGQRTLWPRRYARWRRPRRRRRIPWRWRRRIPGRRDEPPEPALVQPAGAEPSCGKPLPVVQPGSEPSVDTSVDAVAAERRQPAIDGRTSFHRRSAASRPVALDGHAALGRKSTGRGNGDAPESASRNPPGNGSGRRNREPPGHRDFAGHRDAPGGRHSPRSRRWSGHRSASVTASVPAAGLWPARRRRRARGCRDATRPGRSRPASRCGQLPSRRSAAGRPGG